MDRYSMMNERKNSGMSVWFTRHQAHPCPTVAAHVCSSSSLSPVSPHSVSVFRFLSVCGRVRGFSFGGFSSVAGSLAHTPFAPLDLSASAAIVPAAHRAVLYTCFIKAARPTPPPPPLRGFGSVDGSHRPSTPLLSHGRRRTPCSSSAGRTPPSSPALRRRVCVCVL